MHLEHLCRIALEDPRLVEAALLRDPFTSQFLKDCLAHLNRCDPKQLARESHLFAQLAKGLLRLERPSWTC